MTLTLVNPQSGHRRIVPTLGAVMRLVLLLALTYVAVWVAFRLLAGGTLFADDAQTDSIEVVSEKALFGLTPSQLAWVSGLIIPVLVGAATKLQASERVKQVVAIVLSGVVALIGQATLDSGGAVFSWGMLQTWLISLGSTVALYLGVYNKTVPVGNILPDKGLGNAA